MAIKVRLEKEGQLKNAFVGFSWTTFFFGFWVPLFRGKLKDFAYFFMFFLCKIIIFAVLAKEIFDIVYIGIEESKFEISYYIIVPFILMTALYPIDIFLAYTYNKYSTTNMFKEGFYLIENDEYSAAILKDYTYLPYTEEEFADEELLKRYEQHVKKARKSEKNKCVVAIIIMASYQVFLGVVSSVPTIFSFFNNI
ncbi:HrgC protein [Fusobacterium pseudoperiodonticum]|mgnify:CR=1 FL=1|uniref:HrgC protein n=1 Tax=Fusobacterium pseudoperiodonticum TaxID=2663009 RepID=A0A2G9EED4_9FUSO|nr:HrgC protein [Fusobacterium pseudoperiodonticum]PIM79041.1 HrgC protein [Fusobacterium pseudoperiodonticum]